jgi:hypothetical protein
MLGSSKKFEEFEQQAYYSELEESSKSMIISVLADSPSAKQLIKHLSIDYYIIIGVKQPNGAKSIEKIILNIIHLIPRPKRSYSIVYINTMAAKESYDDFKKATEFLPIEYFLHL